MGIIRVIIPELLRDSREDIHEDAAWHVGSKCSVCCVLPLFITLISTAITTSSPLSHHHHCIISISPEGITGT